MSDIVFWAGIGQMFQLKTMHNARIIFNSSCEHLMCEFCCKPWWRFMCICASVEAVTGFNRLIWLVSFCIFLWVLCQGLLVLIGASIFFRGTWMCLLMCTSEDTKTGVNWIRTIFITVIDFNCKLYICTQNPTLDRKLSAKSSCRAIFIKQKLPLEQFYNVWTKCLIFQLKPTFEIGSSLSFWHNRLSQVQISVLQFYPQGVLLRWRWNPVWMEWMGDQTETLHLKASEPPWVYHGIDFARESKLYCRKLRNID